MRENNWQNKVKLNKKRENGKLNIASIGTFYMICTFSCLVSYRTVRQVKYHGHSSTCREVKCVVNITYRVSL